VHALHDAAVAEEGEEGAAVAEEGEEGESVDVDSDTTDDFGDGTTVAVCTTAADMDTTEATDTGAGSSSLSAQQAEQAQRVQATMSALSASIDGLKEIGNLTMVSALETALRKERRKERAIVGANPAVADAFWRLRAAEKRADIERITIAAQQKERKREAAAAISDKNTAVAQLAKTRRLMQELEGTRASAHAIKSFTLESLGKASHNAGGPKAKKNRMEVLDRLKRIRAGLSQGQKNDWEWFKNAWDKAMVDQHGSEWASLFSAWVQGVLDDERSNAFSLFVYNETRRIFGNVSALHVPG
jgi:hypothetical protein